MPQRLQIVLQWQVHPSGRRCCTSCSGSCDRPSLARARARGSPVALCTLNMAVRADSPLEVVEFHRAGSRRSERQVLANQLQTELLRGLATADGQVVVVDSGCDLDGANGDALVDPVHFTPVGRDSLPRNLAVAPAGMRPE